MSAMTSTHTVDDVYKDVTRQFGDEAGVQITQEDVFRWVNSGQEEIVYNNTPIKSVATADIIGGTSTYTFPDNIYKVQSLHVNGVKVDYRTFQEAEEYIIKEDPNKVVTGNPVIWYEWGGTFMLWPTPNADKTAGITIYYIPAVPRVSQLTDLLFIPDPYYNRLLEYVMAQAYELDENWDGAQIKATQFDQGIQKQDRSSIQYDTYPLITILEEDM